MKTQAKSNNDKMADYLKDLRQRQNLTMRALGERIGLPHSFIGKIELQVRRLDIGEFVFYCQQMQTDPLEALKTIIEMPDEAV